MDRRPRNVVLGELYARYSLFEAHAGNSLCCRGHSNSRSSRFHGRTDSVAVGVVGGSTSGVKKDQL